MKHIKQLLFVLIVVISIAFLSYATIIWIYPKAIEIGILIGGIK